MKLTFLDIDLIIASTSGIRGLPFTLIVSQAIESAFSPIRSKSPVAFKILITFLKSLATGC